MMNIDCLPLTDQDFNQVWNFKSENIVHLKAPIANPYCQVHLVPCTILEKVRPTKIVWFNQQPKNRMNERKAAARCFLGFEEERYQS